MTYVDKIVLNMMMVIIKIKIIILIIIIIIKIIINKMSLKLFLSSPTAYRATEFALVFPHRGKTEPGPQSPHISVAVKLTVSSLQ